MTRSVIRCAIYTRKSSEEGLDQDFNSLDAQYEACAAYITSQRQEGWRLAKKRYDDGGISGGTLKRLALQNLLIDIDAGLIDLVVVYKIDRLTRSLSDFSKIVDRLDANQASFVSITQSFNTATSMGRLTLNMLPSFAQFEREVTAERIRDKIAASKAKGLWMGGTVPLGYAPNPDKTIRGLVVREDEADIIKAIFDGYIATGCLRKTEHGLAQQGRTGRQRQGKPASILSRGAIHKILTNPIYIGKIRHKEKAYQGQHDPIIAQDTWKEVQRLLQSNSQKRRGHQLPTSSTAWLKGKLYDASGDHLTPTHTRKNGRAIRYYISNRLLSAKGPTGYRLPTEALEQRICALIANHLTEMASNGRVLIGPTIEQLHAVQTTVSEAFDLQRVDDPRVLSNFANTLKRADIHTGEITLNFDRALLNELLGVGLTQISEQIATITAPFELRKRSVEQKVIMGDLSPKPDRTLQNALTASHHWLEQVKSGTPIAKIAVQSTSRKVKFASVCAWHFCPPSSKQRS